MRALARMLRRIDPKVVGLLRRSLTILGLLIGFAITGSALAHASDRPNPQVAGKSDPAVTRNAGGLPGGGDPGNILGVVGAVLGNDSGHPADNAIRNGSGGAGGAPAPVTRPVTAVAQSPTAAVSGPIAATTSTVLSTVAGVTDPVTTATPRVLRPVLQPVDTVLEPVGAIVRPIGAIVRPVVGIVQPVVGVVQPVVGRVVAVVPPAGGVITPILSGSSPKPQSGQYSRPPAPPGGAGAAPTDAASQPDGPGGAVPAAELWPGPNLVPWAGSAGTGAVLQPVPAFRLMPARAGAPIETRREAKHAPRPSVPTSPADRERDGGGFGSSGGGGPGPVAGVVTTMPRTPPAARCGLGAGPTTRPPHWWFFDPHNHPS